eukprot:8517625-Pyramimonas_sp.AAC.1
MGGEPHANPATGTFGGAPGTERGKGLPKCGGGPHADCATEAFGGAPYGGTKRVRDVAKWG